MTANRVTRARSRVAAVASSDRAVSTLEEHLGYWLRIVSNHVSHTFQRRVEQLGVTVAEWVVLRALFEADGVQPSALAARIGVTRGAVSKLLERLAGKRLIDVHQHPVDRRAQVLALTPAGRRLVPKLAVAADENDAAAFGHLDAERRASLRALLQGLAAHHEIEGTPID